MGDIQSDMSPVGDGGGEEDLLHIHNGRHSVRHVSSDRWGGGERICAMYTVGDTQ